VRRAVRVRDEVHWERVEAGRSAMLEREREASVVAKKVGVRVAEGMEIRGAAEGLARLRAPLLADMMYEDDRDAVSPLQLAKVGQ
jgi:hypothetical protein